MPFETFGLSVDGDFLTPLISTDGNWTQAGAILSSGEHTVSWRYTNNPSGVPDNILGTLPAPDYRIGEAWLDNIELLGTTRSFTEDWESGDFNSQPWYPSGDGNWTINDLETYEGSYSATMATADIEAFSGSADLSIDIITESGGELTFQILYSVSGPSDVVNVLIDNLTVRTYDSVGQEWVPASISIQPGKRKITFQLAKTPGKVPEDVLSGIDNQPGYVGQVWLDSIVFTTN